MFTREQIVHIKASLPWRKHFKPVEGTMFWKRSQARRARWLEWKKNKFRQLAQRRLPVPRRLRAYCRLFTRSLPHLKKKAYQRSQRQSQITINHVVSAIAIVLVLCLGAFLSPPKFGTSTRTSELAKIQNEAPFVAATEQPSLDQSTAGDWNGHKLNINPYTIPPATPDQIVYYTSPLPPVGPQSQNRALFEEQPADLGFVKIN